MTAHPALHPVEALGPEGARTADDLIALGRRFDARGWLLATAGNLSAVVGADPLRLMITATGAHKGAMTREDLVEVDDQGRVLAGQGRPSNEVLLHLAVIRVRGAGAVVHTHSVASTLLSSSPWVGDRIELTGLEMLKALHGVRGPEDRVVLPVLPNEQDIAALAPRAEEALASSPEVHGLLLAGHGLYAWGRDVREAQRHAEALEFVLDVTWRRGAPTPNH
jgi:methylthioribulose-1-phosphate dehydratase